MGFRIQIMLFKGREREHILRDLGLISTGESCEFHDSDIVGVTIPSGDYVVYFSDRNLGISDHKLLAFLSEGGSLFVFTCYEGVMLAITAAFEDGVEQWCVEHQGSESPFSLKVRGNLPEFYSEIENRLVAKQHVEPDSVSVFNIPVELFVACGGFQYDDSVHYGQTLIGESLTRA